MAHRPEAGNRPHARPTQAPRIFVGNTMPIVLDNYRRVWVGLWLAALVLIVITWGVVFSLVHETRIKELTDARQNLFNLSRVSQEHAIRTFRGADQAIRFVEARYLAEGDRLNLTELTRQGVIDTEIFPQVGIIDERGIYALANRPVTGKLDLSDREHFKVHVATDTGELFISKPVLGRSTNTWSIQLTRRITRSDGSFGGVVVVSIALDYFTHFYRDLRMGSHGLVAMYGLDGVARARKVGDLEEFGVNAIRSQAFDRIRQGELDGFYTSVSVVDGVERLHHYRKVPGYPLVVFTALDTQSLFASHNSAKQGLQLGAGIVTALIVALAAALTRYLHQLRRSIDNRLTAQRQIQERNEQLGVIFQLSPDGFVSFDNQQRVSYISPPFSQLTLQGSTPLMGLHEEAFSTWLGERCTADMPFPGVAALRAQALSNQAHEMVLIGLAKPMGRVLQVGLRCSSSSQVSQILYLRDVTHETEVDHMKSEFLAAAAHELRTPMASILGFSEILLTSEFDREERLEFLKTIHSNSQLMANILNDLLDLARIEARRGKDFCYEQVNLCTLLNDWVQGYQRPWGREAPELELPAEPVFVMADPEKLRQALTNVLSNAYKYSPKTGVVRIKVAMQRVSGQPPAVCLDVVDQGIGMTPEQRARVCERFYRADTSGKTLGTGLGMSIVKEIVELHHGNLGIDSTLGHGTRVRLCLPSLNPLGAGASRRMFDADAAVSTPLSTDTTI